MKTLPLLLVAALVLCFGCQSDSKTIDTSAPPPPEAKPPNSPSPEIWLFAVTMNKLNLRNQPNKHGQVVYQLAQGEIVAGNGEISANKEEVTLRNIPYNEPYFKITSTRSSQSEGWAYSAALEPVYAGSQTTKPDTERLSALSGYLQTLPIGQLGSGKSAIDYVKRSFSSSSGTLADAAFILLERFLFRMETAGNLYNLTEEAVAWEENDSEAIRKEQFNMKKYPLTKSLAENGFRLEVGEGMIFPIVDWAILADFFVEKVTPPMKEYLLQCVSEQKDNPFDDGGIVIGLDTLAERAVFWEKFNLQNPYFIRKNETMQKEQWMRLILLTGSDNTRVFDFENHTVAEYFKKAWAHIGQKYVGTQLAKDVQEFTGICEKSGWKQNPSTEAWQTQYRNNQAHQ
jgi:hypothetical protein